MVLPLEPDMMAIALLLAFLAGLTKGVTGFALPMVLLSGLGTFLSAELALAGLILPALVTNLWQAARQGMSAAVASSRRHWRFVCVALVSLAMTAQLVTRMPTNVLFLVLGVPVTVFAILQLIGWRPRVDPDRRRKAEFGFGALAGATGGLSGIWGPPTVMYLTSMNTPKHEHVRVQGVVYATGAIGLLLSHLNTGILDARGLALSAALVVPACIGLGVGFAVLDRLDQDRFRWAILIVLVFAGLNLIRRGLVG